MKTKQEIKEKLNYLGERIKEFGNLTHNNIYMTIGEVNSLNWVLQDDKPKRTIFDLTDEELLELSKILLGKDFNEIEDNEISNECGGLLTFTARYDEGYYYINLYINFDVKAFDKYDMREHINNIIQYSDRIREMLSKPKEGVK